MKLSAPQEEIEYMMSIGGKLITSIPGGCKTPVAWMQKGEPGDGSPVRKVSYCTVNGMIKKGMIMEDYRTVTMVIYKWVRAGNKGINNIR